MINVKGIMHSAIKKAIIAEISKQFPGAEQVKGMFNIDVLRVIIGGAEFETTLRDKINRKDVCAYFGLQRVDTVIVDLKTNAIIIVGDKKISL